MSKKQTEHKVGISLFKLTIYFYAIIGILFTLTVVFGKGG